MDELLSALPAGAKTVLAFGERVCSCGWVGAVACAPGLAAYLAPHRVWFRAGSSECRRGTIAGCRISDGFLLLDEAHNGNGSGWLAVSDASILGIRGSVPSKTGPGKRKGEDGHPFFTFDGKMAPWRTFVSKLIDHGYHADVVGHGVSALPPRVVSLQLAADGPSFLGCIVAWTGDVTTGGFVVAERGSDTAAPFLGAIPRMPASWHVASLADVCARNRSVLPSQLETLRDWLTNDANLRGSYRHGKPQPPATVVVGTMRLPAPACVSMRSARFEHLPSHSRSDGKTIERQKWSYKVQTPGELVSLFLAKVTKDRLNTADSEGWDIGVTQPVLLACRSLRRALPGEYF